MQSNSRMKQSFMPIVTLIIHNVSFCIFNIILNSSLEYFSLVLTDTIPRKAMP